MSRCKSADVRFYFDADILGLARVVSGLRSDVTYPGDPGGTVHRRQRPACEIRAVDTDDDIWIPKVTAQGLVIVTRDSRIQTRRREIQAVRESDARMVALGGEDAIRVFDQLEVLMCRWRDILRCANDPGPFIYAASRTSFRAVSLN